MSYSICQCEKPSPGEHNFCTTCDGLVEGAFDTSFKPWELDVNFSPPARRTHPGHSPKQGPPKIGRNDPCPCASGKKFKKCCGPMVQDVAHMESKLASKGLMPQKTYTF